jgi:hypothetical protein
VHNHGEETAVEIADPIAMMNIVGDSSLEGVASEAETKLRNVIRRLEESEAGK